MEIDASLKEFVTQKLGVDAYTTLENMSRGGNNNAKGSTYESYFTAFKVLELSLEGPNCSWILHRQMHGYVDDVVFLSPGIIKRNYQLKDSPTTGKWTKGNKFGLHFGRQAVLDREHHKINVSTQHLVVSDSKVAADNKIKLEGLGRNDFFCEHFPSSVNSFQLITSCAEVREVIEGHCVDKNLGNLDVVFKLILGVIAADTKAQTVSCIVNMARKNSRPNLFRQDPPEASYLENFKQEISRFRNVIFTQSGGEIRLNKNGLSVLVSGKVDLQHLKGIRDEEELFNFIMAMSFNLE